ncbi:unnamed protein product [Acanthoscelides obtectus]|uniref:Uncharacterized protein n=1 Tax=Acanthoscelides obtectus TaxID=200917 RepID=A0A9P0KP62_ACAOB|nr:unnamed protein product [Acanthoscelides obtectus]CAK1640113.1 hypothetical protein AOBTE_LOCUS11550 [Acanthoscelides obtectus]
MLETLKKAKSFIGITKTKEELDLSETSHLRRNSPINSTMPIPIKHSTRSDLSKTQENLRTLSMQLGTSKRLSNKHTSKDTLLREFSRLNITEKTSDTRLSTERRSCVRNNSFSASQHFVMKMDRQSSNCSRCNSFSVKPKPVEVVKTVPNRNNNVAK